MVQCANVLVQWTMQLQKYFLGKTMMVAAMFGHVESFCIYYLVGRHRSQEMIPQILKCRIPMDQKVWKNISREASELVRCML